MIDLQTRAVSDSQKIHNNLLGVGGFAVSLIFTDPNNPDAQTPISGLYNDTSLLGINPENGLPVNGSKIAVSFHQSDLMDIGLVTSEGDYIVTSEGNQIIVPAWDGTSDIQRWTVQFVNGAGQTILAEVSSVIPDRSFGDMLVMCKIISGH